MAYVAQQRLDGYAERVKYALGRKAAFDRKVIASKAGEVVFKRGQLVQYANSVWDYTFKSMRKLIHYWSAPCPIRERIVNSYTLETLQGQAIGGVHSARRLRPFTPKRGGRLEAEQVEFEEALKVVVDAEAEAEAVAVVAERAAEGRSMV
ncbi:Pro-Pol polyprotein [Mycena sanguinolenta]|uniref:Pro-Pol polyprotein n=1 Tax=Mycena sanguinolenta TaxID=230812 RepID=A0A8H6Z6X0_9AGAR|nr:Pro-Pol polyprotein [Mycena sanguinolenta]